MPLRSFSQAETILTERRRLERPLLAMVWLGAAVLSLIEGAGLYLVAATVAVVANMLAVRCNREISVHRGLINVAVLLASAVLLAELFVGRTEVKLALGHYLILIQLCKLFEHKTNRDYVQIMILSALVMVVGALLSSELWFAVATVVYLVLVCYSAIVFTLKRGLDAAARASLATEPGPIAPRDVAWNVTRRWPGGTLWRYAVLALTGMLIVGVVLFLVTPRGESWGAAAMGSSDGMTMTVSPKLGQARNITLSDRVVMRVRQRGGPVSAYMRGRVFYRYDNSRWSPAGAGWTTEPPIVGDGPLPAGTVVQEIEMATDLLPTLFVAQPAVRVESDQGRVGMFGDTWQLVPNDRDRSRISYRVYVLPQRGQVRAEERPEHFWPPGIGLGQSVYVQDSVARLARQWCADLIAERSTGAVPPEQFDLRIAGRLTERLRRHCTYTLDLTAASGYRDGVEDFLFHLRRGHCEYFASALTVMCRSLGVPSRLVTGFHAEQSGRDGSYVVRQRDAHAWTEVYVPSRGWVVFDATPAAGAGGGRTAAGWLAGLWASVKSFWQENVLEYDSVARDALAKRLHDAWTAAVATVGQAANSLKMSLVKLLVSGQVDRAMFRLAVAVCLLGLGVEVLLIVRAVRRRRRHKRLAAAGQAVPACQFDFARRLFKLLARHGQEWPQCLTPRQMACRSAEALDLSAAHVNELIDLYYRLRWGRITAAADELARARARVDQFARQLSA